MPKTALGRGLGALMNGPAGSAQTPTTSVPAAAAPSAEDGVRRVSVGRVRPCPLQPRKDFSKEALQELAESIRQQGIVQPLIVRARGDGFELIAGERRWRAAQLLGLKDVPVIVREADDRAALELALIENLQRENLNAIEEALGFEQLIQKFSMTQDEAASKVGRSRAGVANALRLLKLEPTVQSWVRDGRLSVGHAKVILGLARPQDQKAAAERVLKQGYNVRQTEEMVAQLQRPVAGTGTNGKKAASGDAHTRGMQSKLQQRFGTKVQLHYREGKGTIEIKFFSDEDLERILRVAGIDLE